MRLEVEVGKYLDNLIEDLKEMNREESNAIDGLSSIYSTDESENHNRREHDNAVKEQEEKSNVEATFE